MSVQPTGLTGWQKFRMLIFGSPLEAEESILPIPAERKTYSLWVMFLMFAGTQIAISFFVVGASTLAGVTVAAALSATFLGYGVVGGFIDGLIGRIGFNEGIPTMVAIRPSFGVRGSMLGVIITIIELGGWNAVHVALGGNALYLLLRLVGVLPESPAYLLLCVIAIGVVTVLIASRGGVAIKNMDIVVVPILFISLIYVTIVAAAGMSLTEILAYKSPGTGSPLYLFDITITSALTWAPMCADHSRLSKTRAASLLGIWLGLLVVGVGMHGIGMVSAAGIGEPNPLVAIATVGGVPGALALFTILFATLTTAVLILYSSSVSLINIAESFGGKGRLWWTSLIIGVPCIILASFIQVIYFVMPYLEFLGIMLCPLFGIMLCDYYVLRKGRGFDRKALYESGKGLYWGFRGFNIAGYGAWIVGAVLYQVTMSLIKPLYPWVMGSIVGIIGGAVVYLILFSALGYQVYEKEGVSQEFNEGMTLS